MIEFSWALTLILGVISLFLVNRLFREKGYWETRGVTSIKTSIFTTLRLFFFSNKSFFDFTIELYNKYKGEKYVGYFMQQPVLMINDPELISRILIKDFSHFEDRAKPIEGEAELVTSGLASLTGEKWRILRHKLTPTFTSGKMKVMVNQIKECSDEFVLFLKDKKGVDLESRDFLFKFMINCVGLTAFSMKIDAFNRKNNQFLEISKQFFKPSFKTQFKFFIAVFIPKVKTWFNLRFVDTDVNDFFLDLTKDLIAQRRNSGKRRNDFLQLMLDLQDKELAIKNQTGSEKLTSDVDAETPEDRELLEYIKNLKTDKDSDMFNDDTIAAQTFLFISGGSETTSTVLSFALHQLAVNKNVQKKLQDEVDTILKTNELTYESVRKMKYLEQILYEVLRLHFSGVLTRVCVQDYKVPDSDLVIKKDCLIQIAAVGIHRDPQYFSDPEKFYPERFEDMDAIPKGVFLPFGGGPRMCIAMRLAMLEMKIFLAVVMSSYNVFHSEKTPLPLQLDKKSFLQHVKNGLWVKFEPRQ